MAAPAAKTMPANSRSVRHQPGWVPSGVGPTPFKDRDGRSLMEPHRPLRHQERPRHVAKTVVLSRL